MFLGVIATAIVANETAPTRGRVKRPQRGKRRRRWCCSESCCSGFGRSCSAPGVADSRRARYQKHSRPAGAGGALPRALLRRRAGRCDRRGRDLVPRQREAARSQRPRQHRGRAAAARGSLRQLPDPGARRRSRDRGRGRIRGVVREGWAACRRIGSAWAPGASRTTWCAESDRVTWFATDSAQDATARRQPEGRSRASCRATSPSRATTSIVESLRTT